MRIFLRPAPLRALVFALVGLLAGAPARAEDFQLDDVSVAAPFGSYRAKRIEIFGSPLTKDAAQKLLSPATPGSGEEKSAQLEAARIVIPELIAESRAGDYEQTAIYRDVAMSKVVKGVAETVEIAGAVTGPGGTPIPTRTSP